MGYLLRVWLDHGWYACLTAHKPQGVAGRLIIYDDETILTVLTGPETARNQMAMDSVSSLFLLSSSGDCDRRLKTCQHGLSLAWHTDTRCVGLNLQALLQL